ncbi:MAG: DUF2927 domain-containing protein [Cyclobacteriaceae bacterium]|nr:DUF2927 domain-containing protein [Cyclobacteriaceae bacterium]
MIEKIKPIKLLRVYPIWNLFVSIFILSGCSDDEIIPKEQFTPYQKEVMEYFVDVALGFEFGDASKVTRKWKSEVRIFVGGDKTAEMLSELDGIISELEELTDQLSFSITQDTTESNFYLYFGTGSSFALRFPPAQNHIAANWGLFYVYYNSSDEIYSAVMYVDTQRAQGDARKHLLREELTQSLGLARDSDRYPQSIFYGPWTTGTVYAPIDRDLVRLLYHPNVGTGYNETVVRTVLKDLVKQLNIGA